MERCTRGLKVLQDVARSVDYRLSITYRLSIIDYRSWIPFYLFIRVYLFLGGTTCGPECVIVTRIHSGAQQ